jgi:hypothetical protein
LSITCTDQRYYLSIMGRFLTPDTAPANPSNPQSWNRHAYALSDPINLNDPSGMLAAPSVYDGPLDPLAMSPLLMAACLTGKSSSQVSVTPTMRAWQIFDPLAGVIGDCDYGSSASHSLSG